MGMERIAGMKIKEIVVDKIPENCGDCLLMRYLSYDGSPHCTGIDYRKSEILGNPYAMKYRRSDCPLKVEE